ncbi:MAG: translation elongation factor Ts [Candidatus Eiseniibacteriota bacterium]|jgi:elongation factor Ts
MSTITAAQVKELRERTGAGMMDCKRALSDTDGDMEKAIEELRARGIAAAGKRAGRETKEGQVVAYIHPGGRIGVLLEVGCETDFVARTDDFQNLCREIAMQVAATEAMAVERDSLDPEFLATEHRIFMAQAAESGKPEAVLTRIVEGKIEKRMKEVVLLEQSSIRDPDKTVQDLVNEAIGRIGENIVVRRFARFRLGES